MFVCLYEQATEQAKGKGGEKPRDRRLVVRSWVGYGPRLGIVAAEGKTRLEGIHQPAAHNSAKEEALSGTAHQSQRIKRGLQNIVDLVDYATVGRAPSEDIVHHLHVRCSHVCCLCVLGFKGHKKQLQRYARFSIKFTISDRNQTSQYDCPPY